MTGLYLRSAANNSSKSCGWKLETCEAREKVDSRQKIERVEPVLKRVREKGEGQKTYTERRSKLSAILQLLKNAPELDELALLLRRKKSRSVSARSVDGAELRRTYGIDEGVVDNCTRDQSVSRKEKAEERIHARSKFG